MTFVARVQLSDFNDPVINVYNLENTDVVFDDRGDFVSIGNDFVIAREKFVYVKFEEEEQENTSSESTIGFTVGVKINAV